jgi:alpha-tubulin suppressor-like RCC1 family protein
MHCLRFNIECRLRRSVYSVGCGLGGKLGHGCKNDKGTPKLIEHFQSLSFKPVSISAGTWHAAALGEDGRVCTWGWGHTGCLGHGDEDYKSVPTIVEALSNVKAVHLSTGENTTFVVADNGDVYSFGSGEFLNVGLQVQPFSYLNFDLKYLNYFELLKIDPLLCD